MVIFIGVILLIFLVVIGYLLKSNDELKRALMDCKNKLKRGH